jgi:hypothetical protein
MRDQILLIRPSAAAEHVSPVQKTYLGIDKAPAAMGAPNTNTYANHKNI